MVKDDSNSRQHIDDLEKTNSELYVENDKLKKQIIENDYKIKELKSLIETFCIEFKEITEKRQVVTYCSGKTKVNIYEKII